MDLPQYVFSAIIGDDRVLPGGTVARGLHSLYAQGMRIYHGLDTEAMVGSLLYTMRSLGLDDLDEFVRIHGGAVAMEGGGVLLPVSEASPDLPALVATLLRKGAAYLGDEIAPIEPVLRRIHPVPFPLLLDPSDVSRFPRIDVSGPPRTSTRATPGRYAVPPEAFGDRSAEPAPVRWIAFPSFEPGAETRLEPVGAADAVFGLSRSCANLDVWEARGLTLFRDMAEGVEKSRLVIGSLEEAADLIAEAAPTMVRTEEGDGRGSH
jgi:hypothetical protein